MAPNEQFPRLNFLKDCANSLNSLSPSTAAHLLTVHNQILHYEYKPLNQRHHETTCGACGSIRKPEWTKTFQIQKKNAKRVGSSTAKGATSGGATIYKCLRCHRRTVKTVRSNITSKSVTTTAVSNNRPSASTATLPEQVSEARDVNRESKTVDNASSKKRAKARKQGGLHALLASKQQSQSNKSSASLDLFDFLQQ